MHKILFPLFLTLSLWAKTTSGIAVIVQDKPITTYDIKKEMQLTHLDEAKATQILIRHKLEESELENRGLNVTSGDVYAEIQSIARRNNMSVSKFYELLRDKNGLNSTEFREKIKERLLSQKLYNSIAYGNIKQPSNDEIEEYYQLHKKQFSHPYSFTTTIYGAKSSARLQEKINNPMLYAPDISSAQQILYYSKIAPKLSALLSKTAPQTFTPVIPDGRGGFMSFYIHSVEKAKDNSSVGVHEEILNKIMAQKREQVLGDYFAKLRHNADIKIIRGIN
jgi:parvulin-like peptidyl-prolyl isomerase